MRVFKINRMKSEAPLIAVFAVFSIFMSLIFFPRMMWYSFLIFPLMLLAYLTFRKLELGLFKKQCFLIVDDAGIRYCFHLFQQARALQWDQIEKVNFQLYEINFRLKVSGQVISIQKSYLDHQEEIPELKSLILTHCELM